MSVTKRLKSTVLLVALSTACGSNTIELSDVWARATVPGQKVAAAYVTIKTPGAAALVAAESEVAEAIEIHSMSMEEGMMRMQKLDRLALPPGKATVLEPAGHHLMLLNLRGPLHPGETIPLTLVFELGDKRRVKVETSAEVRGRAD